MNRFRVGILHDASENPEASPCRRADPLKVVPGNENVIIYKSDVPALCFPEGKIPQGGDRVRYLALDPLDPWEFTSKPFCPPGIRYVGEDELPGDIAILRLE